MGGDEVKQVVWDGREGGGDFSRGKQSAERQAWDVC